MLTRTPASQFKPGYLGMGSQGAERVQQHLKDIVAARFAVDSTFIHVVVVVDIDAFVLEADLWGQGSVGRVAVRAFFGELKSHANIAVSKWDMESARNVIESKFPFPRARVSWERKKRDGGKGAS